MVYVIPTTNCELAFDLLGLAPKRRVNDLKILRLKRASELSFSELPQRPKYLRKMDHER